MPTEFNKAMLFPLVDEISRASTNSGKSRNEVLEIVALQNPEITYSPEEWDTLDSETQNRIIARIKRSIASIS